MAKLHHSFHAWRPIILSAGSIGGKRHQNVRAIAISVKCWGCLQKYHGWIPIQRFMAMLMALSWRFLLIFVAERARRLSWRE